MRKNYFVSILIFLVSATALGAKYFDDIRVDSIGVGTMSPSSATVLDVVSTSKAARPCPVMTTSQRDAIVSPALGSCIFNFDDDILNYYDGSTWGAISQPGAVLGPVSSTDNAIVRFDGTSGTQIQNSSVTITDAGVLGGATQFNQENLRLDQNTISTTDTNGNLLLEPNGTGQVVSTKTIKGATLESTGDLIIAGPWQGVATTDSTTTGSDTTLANPASLVVSLTNSSLQSISHITSGVSRFAIVTNKTGNILTVKEVVTGTAANRIITGTGGDIEIENGGSFLISYIAGSVNRWHVVGGTGTGGGGPPPQQFTQKNDYNFESTVGNWVRYNDGASASPVDCTGGVPSADFSFSRESSVPLVGRGSGFINASNLANTQGEGVSVTVPINTVYQNRPLYLEFDYFSFGGYANDDFKVFVYDVTNATLLNNGQPYSQTAIGTSYGRFFANITPGSNSGNLRVCIHNSTTATTLKALHFDEVRLGLAEGVTVPITQEQVINVAGSGGFTGGSIRVARAGGVVSISVVSDLTHASANGISSAAGLIPYWARPDSEKVNMYGAPSNSNQFRVSVQADGTLGTTYRDFTGANVNATSSSVRMNISYSVSSPNTTSGIAAQANPVSLSLSRTGSNQSGAASMGVQFNTTTIEGSGLEYNSTNNRIIASRRIKLIPGGNISTTISAANTGQSSIYWRVNGSTTLSTRVINNTTASAISSDVPGGAIILNAGDYLELMVANSGGTISVQNASAAVVTLTEAPFTNTAIQTGPIYLGERTFTSSQANMPFTGKVYRDGQFVEIHLDCLVSGAITGAPTLTIPADLEPDLNYSNNRLYKLADLVLRDASGGSYQGLVLNDNSTQLIIRRAINDGTNGIQPSTFAATTPFTWASGDTVVGVVRYKVKGW